MRSKRPEDTADERSIESSGRSFAAHISDGERGPTGAVIEKVVQISADRARGDKACGDLGPRGLGRLRWQEAQLHLASHVEIALKTLLLLMNALVQARICDGDGNLRSEGRQCALVVFVVVVEPRMFQIDHADNLALVDQGNGEFRAGLWVVGDVAWIFANIGNEHWLTELGSDADQTFSEVHVARARNAFSVARTEPVFQLLVALAPQKNREHLKVDHALE